MRCDIILCDDPLLHPWTWHRDGHVCGTGPCMDTSTAPKENTK
jgi:hypothetical protein